ncbi:MAG TPA: glycosyltransferase, partial [Patescibacteria group bacterium]|nr:glycosyltransferase [Patescibacteria group bacterium]
ELEIGYLSGAGVLGRVSLIEQCGLFDPEFFMYHEDTDATFQARIRGFKTVIEPTSVVYHHYEFAKSMSKYYLMEKNRWAMVFSYYRLWSLMTVLPLFLAMELALLGFSLKRGWWKEKKRVYREVFNRRFWQWIAVRRKKIQAERVISDAELFRSMVATVKFQGEDVSNPLLTHIGNPVMRAYWWIVQRLVV